MAERHTAKDRAVIAAHQTAREAIGWLHTALARLSAHEELEANADIRAFLARLAPQQEADRG